MGDQQETCGKLNFAQKDEVDKTISSIRTKLDALDKDTKKAWLMKAIGFIDLTTLGGDDTPIEIRAVCEKAVNPLGKPTEPLHTAAVCVYPTRLKDAVTALAELDEDHKVARATVGGDFPSGQLPLEERIKEVESSIEGGADEIDIVINRYLAITQQWNELNEEVKSFAKICKNKVCLKVILSTGELGNMENVYSACIAVMMAGAKFIKTSTGKETVNATLPVGIVMCHAIKRYYELTRIRVGFKPAGGIKTAQEALEWMMLVQTELGDEWLTKDLFRIGASSLLDNIVETINSM